MSLDEYRIKYSSPFFINKRKLVVDWQTSFYLPFSNHRLKILPSVLKKETRWSLPKERVKEGQNDVSNSSQRWSGGDKWLSPNSFVDKNGSIA